MTYNDPRADLITHLPGARRADDTGVRARPRHTALSAEPSVEALEMVKEGQKLTGLSTCCCVHGHGQSEGAYYETKINMKKRCC